ncbi:MAG: hypothetical protein FWF94_07215 [Oscillospiraceae bacterium]|nr:hypothetical protein [Oscillospiraceae bacterium]
MKKIVLLFAVLIFLTACGGSEKTPSNVYIKGTQYSTDMTKLILYSLEVTNEDLEPLRHMTKLQKLNIAENYISNISVLSELKDLDMIRMNGNNISNISALYELTNLREIWLFDNPISDERIEELRAALPDCLIVNEPVEQGER